MKFRYDASIPFRKVLSKLGDAGTFLLRAIQVWTQTPLDPLDLPPVDEALGIQCAIEKAVQSQTCIGWSNFFRGFVSLDWGAIASRTELNRLTPDDRYAQSEKTLTAVITAVQEYSLAIWKRSRNDVLHEAGSDSLSIVHAALNHSITQLYLLRSTFSSILQSYFTVPLAARLRQSPRQRTR
ncbi:hypothetical protein MHU86_5193 [Fragilaria crotonensis]|nr:hypothetical protein MHU86_5193 [Fragilaria crotonensis]